MNTIWHFPLEISLLTVATSFTLDNLFRGIPVAMYKSFVCLTVSDNLCQHYLLSWKLWLQLPPKREILTTIYSSTVILRGQEVLQMSNLGAILNLLPMTLAISICHEISSRVRHFSEFPSFFRDLFSNSFASSRLMLALTRIPWSRTDNLNGSWNLCVSVFRHRYSTRSITMSKIRKYSSISINATVHAYISLIIKFAGEGTTPDRFSPHHDLCAARKLHSE